MSSASEFPEGKVQRARLKGNSRPRDDVDEAKIREFCRLRLANIPQRTSYLTAVNPNAKNPAAAASVYAKRAAVQNIMLELREGAVASAIRQHMYNEDKIMEVVGEVIERSMQHKPVLDKSGKATGEWKFDGPTALRAVELYGRQLGMFEKTSNVRHGDLDPIQGKSPSQVVELFGEASERILEEKQRQFDEKDVIDVECNEPGGRGSDHGDSQDEQALLVSSVPETG